VRTGEPAPSIVSNNDDNSLFLYGRTRGRTRELNREKLSRYFSEISSRQNNAAALKKGNKRQKKEEVSADILSNKDFADLNQFFCQICFHPNDVSNKAEMDSCKKHDFCYECLLQWALNKNTCPSCSVPVHALQLAKPNDSLFLSQQ
jgi:hypothetical protein